MADKDYNFKDDWQAEFEKWKLDNKKQKERVEKDILEGIEEKKLEQVMPEDLGLKPKSNDEIRQDKLRQIKAVFEPIEKFEKRMEKEIQRDIKRVEKEVIREEKAAVDFVKKEEREHPVVTKLILTLAWLIPLLIILGVLYINFLPFGYEKNYILNVDENGSVTSNFKGLWLEDMKAKKITNLSDVYSYGSINLVLKPSVVLRDAEISVSLQASNSSDIYFPILSDNITNSLASWQYFWNFSLGVPSSLKGTAKYDKEKGCVYFNASNNETLFYPNSSNMFENGSFVVYASWEPENTAGINQQILGHYNWELWQSNNSIRFMVGRLDNKTGSMPSISYPIDNSFFNKQHEAVLVYKADKKSGLGYIELYVDDEFVGRKVIDSSVIYRDYNSDRDLSLGWSNHNYGNNSYYTGCMYSAGFDYYNTKPIDYTQDYSFDSSSDLIKIPVIGTGNLSSIKISVKQ